MYGYCTYICTYLVISPRKGTALNGKYRISEVGEPWQLNRHIGIHTRLPFLTRPLPVINFEFEKDFYYDNAAVSSRKQAFIIEQKSPICNTTQPTEVNCFLLLYYTVF